MMNNSLAQPPSDSFLFGLTFFLIIFIGGIMWLLPRLSNPSLFFAVTVDPEFRDSREGRAITSSYRRQIFWFSMLLLLLTLAGALAAGPSPQRQAAFGLAAQLGSTFALLIVSFLFYTHARRRVLPYAVEPSPIREASLRPFHPRHRGILGLLWVGPFLLFAGCAVYLHQHWAEVPARFPIHWGASGQPNGWANKTPLGVGMPLIIGAVMVVMMFGLSLTIRHIRRKYVSGPLAEREERIRFAGELLLLGVAYSMVLTFAPLCVWIPFRKAAELPQGYLLLSLGSTFGVIIILVGYMAWAASRRDGETEPVGDRTPDRCWKWGLIYYNPDDQAIWVEKRFGIGWTLNFGRPMSWVLLVLLLSPVLIVALVLGLKAK